MTPRESGCADDCCHPDHRHIYPTDRFTGDRCTCGNFDPVDQVCRCRRDHRHVGYTDPAALRIVNRHIVKLVLEANPFLRALAEFRGDEASGPIMPLVVPPSLLAAARALGINAIAWQYLPEADTHEEWRRLNTEAE